MHALQLLFWLAALGLFYTYAGYALLLAVWAHFGATGHRRSTMAPDVSILVVAHNEEKRIRRRIENLIALEYRGNRPQIVIASDASSDATVPLASEYREAGVEVVAFDRHRGKAAVLNDMIPRLSGEIVVLMDVRQYIAPDAVQNLVDDFADPMVGAVSGELVLTEGKCDEEGVEGIGFYWRLEKFIRLKESQIDSAVGATGALYAIRRRLFEPIPEDTLLDDVLIPMQIARQGFRVLFEPAARASERLSPNPRAEFRRKARTIAGNFQLLFRHPWMSSPRANRLWFQTFSHKFLRLFGPVFLTLALVANVFLTPLPLYRLMLALQIAFYAAAAAGHAFPRAAKRIKFLSVPHAVCLLNWCTIAGFYRFVRGSQQVTWAPTGKEARQ